MHAQFQPQRIVVALFTMMLITIGNSSVAQLVLKTNFEKCLFENDRVEINLGAFSDSHEGQVYFEIVSDGNPIYKSGVHLLEIQNGISTRAYLNASDLGNTVLNLYDAETDDILKSEDLEFIILPEYDIQINESICDGQESYGVIVDVPESITIKWFDDLSDKERYDLSPGSYSLTLYNGICEMPIWFDIEFPVEIDLQYKSMSLNCGNSVSLDLLELIPSGGVSPYMFDWLMDGEGNPVDDLYYQNLEEGIYELNVIDATDCQKAFKVEVIHQQEIALVANDVKIYPREVGSTGSVFLLSDAEMMKNGDVDGDNSNGSILTVEYYMNEWDAVNGEDALAEEMTVSQETTLIAKVMAADDCYKTSEVTLVMMPGNPIRLEYLLQDEACDHEGPFLLAPSPGLGIPSGGVFTLNSSSNGTNPIFQDPITGDYLFNPNPLGDPAGGEGLYDIFYTVNGVTYGDILAVQALNFGFFAESETVCGNDPALTIQKVPNQGGQISGPGVSFDNTLTPPSYVFDPNGLTPGDYTIRYVYGGAFDSEYKCPDTIYTTVEVLETPEFDLEVSTESVCDGTNFKITAIKNSNVPITNFEWEGPNGFFGSDTTFIEVFNATAGDSGDYYFRASDENGCFKEASVYVDVLPPPQILCDVDASVQCNGDANGTATIEVLVGDGPFTYLWSTGEETATSTQLVGGLNNATVTDVHGCQVTCEIFVDEPDNILVSEIVNQNVYCYNDESGSVSLNISGGSPPYEYLWSNGVTTSENNSLPAGVSTITVTDNNGCILVDEVTLMEPGEMFVNAEPQEFCLDFTNEINGSFSGGTEIFTDFQWTVVDAGTTNASNVNLINANTSTVTFSSIGLDTGIVVLRFSVTDSNGCIVSDEIEVRLNHCFDLAIRKIAEVESNLYPGDTVDFTITLFNQGVVDAYDLVIEDDIPDGLIFTTENNQAAVTGNPYDWTVENNQVVTRLDYLAFGDSFKISTKLIIDEAFTGTTLENTARIIEYSNGEVDNPQDEDDADDEDNETDDEIDDDSNGGMDDPEDEDKSDYADVEVCQTVANPLELKACVEDFQNGTACFDFAAPDILDHIDGNGDGDGDSADGDSGARVTCHATLAEAKEGTNDMGELVCTAGQVIFARVTEENGCFAVAEIDLKVRKLQPVQDQPDDINVVLETGAQFCITTGDANYLIQWQEKINGQWVDLDGENSQCLYIPVVYLNDDDRQFRVLIEGLVDGEMCQMYSREALLKAGCSPAVCNDHINLSINNTCEVTVTPDMVTEGPLSATVEVTIKDQYGNEYGDKVGPHLWGQLLTVEILETCDGSKCWGTLTVEDKYINPIVCEDVVLECNDPIAPGLLAPFPQLTDYDITLQSDGSFQAVKEAICDTVFLTYDDDIELLTCHDELSRIITRHWYASDPYGNKTNCVQTISIRRIFIGDITPPANYDGFDENAFFCDDVVDFDNIPGPTWNGMDIPDLCHNFNIIYDDTRFDICPGSYKIHREWTLIDWCTQDILVYEQIIKVEPRVPSCKEPRNLETLTSGYTCTADYKVPAPDFDNPCNVPYTYTVRWASYNEALQVFNQPTTLGITGNQNSGYTINGLPQGKSRIYYRIEDACNKIANCFDNITVNDETSPNAIGKEFITATLGITAWTRVFAESVNEGSHDNCAIEKIEVARMDDLCDPDNTLVFRDFVEFCCADVGNSAMVVMRVTDTSGNTSEVMVEVQVQNKIIPELECPDTYVVECTSHGTIPTPDVSGWPLATNVDAFCPQFLIEYEDSEDLNDCGIGTIRRHFFYRDAETDEILVDCYQTLNVIDSNPFDENDIDWPSNTELTGCLYDLDPDSPNSPVHGPDIYDQQCALIAVEYSDQVFEDVAVACGKVLRTWTVIDWCQFEAEFPDVDPNQNGIQDGIWSETQTIALYNDEAPEITNCSPTKIFIPGYGACEEPVTMTREATDDCVSPELLAWTYQIDIGNDGTFEPSYAGNSNSFTKTIPFGEHRILWSVSDPCNNRDFCEEIFEVYDDKAPTPVCLSEIVTVVLGEDNHVEIWAVDFEASSYDNCSQYLYYSFSQNENDDRRSFDCTDIPEGETEIEIPLQMWVTDAVGLQDFCEVTMVLQNNNIAECDYNLSDTDVIGRVSTEMDEMMENVKLELLDETGVMIMEAQTDDSGAYAFEDVPMYNNYALVAEKNDDVLNGVSTLDIVLMQRHVLGVKALDSPYKLLAADVDGNHKVSAIDLINLRKVILGIIEFFPNDVDSWKFIDANMQFEDPNQPWYQDYMPNVNNFDSELISNDLMGIKVGDVNNSVVANMTSGVNIENRSNKKMFVGFDHNSSTHKMIPVYLDTESSISGFQFNLKLGEEVGSVKLLPGSLILNQNNFKYSENSLSISHSTAVGINVSKDDPAFFIEYSGIWDSDISLTSNGLIAEAYDGDLNIMSVELRDSEVQPNELISEFTVSLSPNPVIDFAIIDFETSFVGQMTLNVFDQTGRRVHETMLMHEGGQAQISFNTTSMSAGLYFYELRAGAEVYKSKMLIMK